MRFAFISHGAWGHVDFGGGGFWKTAAALVERGHSVRWWLIRGPEWSDSARFTDALQARGVCLAWIDGPLSLLNLRGAGDAVRRLAALLHDVDVCVIDRLATLAGIAAHAAGIPWAAVGTDGRPWTRTAAGTVWPGVHDTRAADAVCRDLGAVDYPLEARRSYWLLSPFLNLSFLPECYYTRPLPQTAHAVGGDRSAICADRRVVVATLGTSLEVGRERDLLSALTAASQATTRPWKLLGRGSGGTQFVPYDVAFAEASLAIGHGGTAFLWHAFDAGIPILALPSPRGDQRYGARRVVRLGLGRSHEAEGITPQAITAAVERLIDDPTVRQRAQAMRRALASNGIGEAARLLERLAEHPSRRDHRAALRDDGRRADA